MRTFLFSLITVALAACAPAGPDTSNADAPADAPRAVGQFGKADEATLVEPLECDSAEGDVTHLASLPELLEELGGVLADRDDCELIVEFLDHAEGQPPAEPVDAPAVEEPVEEYDEGTERAYERYLREVERLANDPTAHAASLQLAQAMFGTEDLNDSEYDREENALQRLYDEGGVDLEIPLDDNEDVEFLSLDPEFESIMLEQAELEPEEEEGGMHTHTSALRAGSCSEPESFWPPAVNQPSEFMNGTALAVVVFLDRDTTGFAGWNGGRFDRAARQRARDAVRVSQRKWAAAARRFGGSIRFAAQEVQVDMRRFGTTQDRWTENQMIYPTLHAMQALPGRDLRRESWGRYNWSKRMGDLHSAGDRLRKTRGVDHVYFVFVADSFLDFGPRFRTGHGAYAYANQGVMYFNSTAWGLGINAYQTAHETGHVFGALDHYKQAGVGCRQTGGYLGVATTIQEDGNDRRGEGCTGNDHDIMDRFSRVAAFWIVNGGQDPITTVTADQTGLRGVTDGPNLSTEVAGAYRFSSFLGSNEPLNLYVVKYETEVGAKHRARSVTGGKNYLTGDRLAEVTYQNPYDHQWKRHPLKAGARTQVQCGVTLFAKWGAPANHLRTRVTDSRGRHVCAEIDRMAKGARNRPLVRGGNCAGW